MQLGPNVERVDDDGEGRCSELYDECWGIGGPRQIADDLPPRKLP